MRLCSLTSWDWIEKATTSAANKQTNKQKGKQTEELTDKEANKPNIHTDKETFYAVHRYQTVVLQTIPKQAHHACHTSFHEQSELLQRSDFASYTRDRRPSCDDSFHSPTVIPPSALDKPSITKRYHRRQNCSHTSPRRSPTMVTLHDGLSSADGGMTVGQ